MKMTASTLLHSLFRQKAWINAQFFDQLAKLDPAAHEGELRTMVRTLNHIHVVDRIFAAHLRGEAHGYDGTNTTETPTQAALRASVAEVDAWYVEYTRALSPEQLAEVLDFRFTDGDGGRMSREEILAHVATHGSYHRGEVGRLLKNTPTPPPRDLFTKFLHDTEPQRRA
jgi:uncharacterized damage-inducible protein DinB